MTKCGQPAPSLWFAAQYFLFEVGPEFGADIGQQIEADLSRTLHQAQLYSVDPVGIPLIGYKICAICTSKAPGGKGLAARVRACKDSASESVLGAAPKPGIGRAIVSRVLVQG